MSSQPNHQLRSEGSYLSIAASVAVKVLCCHKGDTTTTTVTNHNSHNVGAQPASTPPVVKSPSTESIDAEVREA